MPDNSGNENIVRTIITFILGGGLMGVGAWLLKYMDRVEQSKDKQSANAADKERTMVQEYRKIIEDKDKDFAEERDEWRTEKRDMITEMARTRNSLQRYMVDSEAMRQRIAAQDREIAMMTGEHGADRKFLGDRFDAVIIYNTKGEIKWCNETASIFTGWPLEKLLTMNATALMSPAFGPKFLEEIGRIPARMAAERGNIVEKIVRCKTLLHDGTELPTDWIMSIFPCDGVFVCRTQIRRRFDRPDDSGDVIPAYVPSGASASGIVQGPISSGTTAPVIQAEVLHEDRPDGK